MRSPHYFLVKPLGGKRYDNTSKVGDEEIVLSTSLEDAKETQRQAIVVTTPFGYKGPVNDDALVLTHHNVFRRFFDTKGREKSSSSHFRDDLYIVEPERVFMYKNDWAFDWVSLDPYCFIEPLSNEGDSLSRTELKEFWGVVRFANPTMESEDLENGDIVSYKPETEYEFRIDGKVYYRMYIKDICLKK
jgi:hypothetical protein